MVAPFLGQVFGVEIIVECPADGEQVSWLTSKFFQVPLNRGLIKNAGCGAADCTRNQERGSNDRHGVHTSARATIR